ncbi:hypothetical protein PmNV_047 [Penaeus monodon nudivirus]|uniref:Uncharacterized protein n=1 Tax=Penaeus monodon nudivirus TaxID=1529056 RepID=A0A076FDY7_9VIRU|nr:hypothetical protein PmNV_047 [Penaeus monodon nudivirus]AII15835.1 hypothetical protein PmNV_047 [Penaeus monodon nudivirus]
MNVYKSKFNAKSKPLILEKSAISNEEDVKFKILVLPKNTSLYALFADASVFNNMSMTIVMCNIFIVVEGSLSGDILDTIESYIEKNITETFKINEPVTIRPYGVAASVEDAISSYKNITIHYSGFSNDLYNYINYRSLNEVCIDEYNEIITYKHLNDRKLFSSVSGKVAEDRSVSIFEFYPLKNVTTVFIIPDEFYILPESKNRIALMKIGVFTFWLVSRYHSFFNRNDVPELVTASSFSVSSLPSLTMSNLYNVFQKYEFYNLNTSESCIYSEDVANNLLFFVGIYDLSNSFKYAKCFDMITY